MIHLYWEIKCSLIEKYLKHRYKNKAPGIYHDTITGMYVHPKLVRHAADTVEDVAEVLAECGLYYPCNIGDEQWHYHDFPSVLITAYEAASSFSISKEDEQYYSEQELVFIRALVERGIKDGCVVYEDTIAPNDGEI